MAAVNLNEDVLKYIHRYVRGGFEVGQEPPGGIKETYVDRSVSLTRLWTLTGRARCRRCFNRRRGRKKTQSLSCKTRWPKVTDCDRLDNAFTALRRRGIVALHKAGNDQSDGHDIFRYTCSRANDRNSIIGYCFYHLQDLERAIDGGGLYISFGPTDPKMEEVEGAKIGRSVKQELGRAGLEVIWDETFAKRIFIKKFEWRRRQSPPG